MNPTLWFVVWIATWQALMLMPAQGQHTHEGEAGKFYQTWLQPDLQDTGKRTKSCCGNADCRPILAIRKSGSGEFEVEAMAPYEYPKRYWYRVPEQMWEDAQADPRESPDGRGHVCINNGQVICAVRSGGF